MPNMMKDLSTESDVPIMGNVVTVTLSWKTTSGGEKGLMGRAKAAVEIDLDAMAVLYGSDGPKDVCYHANLDPCDNGSIVLGKDAGAGGGGIKMLKRMAKGTGSSSQEVIVARLADLPPWVQSFTLLAAAFKDDVKITDAESVSLVLQDEQGNQVFFKPTITDTGNVCIMCRVYRQGDGFRVRMVNDMVTANSKSALLAASASA